MLHSLRSLILTLCFVALTACGPPAASKPTSVSSLSTVASEKPTSAVAATSGATGAGAQVPGSCDDLVTLVGTYMGGVAMTKSLGTPQHLSCEFANADASTIIVVNIGVGGTPAAFDALRSTSAKGGRTVTSIDGLGASAFSVSKNGKPAGISVLTDQGFVYAVISNLAIAQDEALIEQLMKLS